MAERIRRAVEASRLELPDQSIRATVSIGLSSYPEDGGDSASIMDKADRALYRAKQAGKNCVCSYSQDLTPSATAKPAAIRPA